jgi:Flp pilus assembly protein TadB
MAMIYLPILILILGVHALLLLSALHEFVWYRNWSRKRQFKSMKKHYNK